MNATKITLRIVGFLACFMGVAASFIHPDASSLIVAALFGWIGGQILGASCDD